MAVTTKLIKSMGENYEKTTGSGLGGTGANWTTDLLASRLYAERGQKVSKGSESSGRKPSKTLNTRLAMSQSTPALKTISPVTSSPAGALERKATLKTNKLIGDTNRSLLKKPLGSSSTTALPPLDSKPSVDSEISQISEQSTKSTPAATFLQSLNLSPKLHHELFHVPHTFFYLQAKTALDTKAYDLQLISQDKVDKNQYYTISKEGITLHRAADSEFTTLSQWEREYSLFHQISVIPFFRQYRRWKVGFSFILSHIWVGLHSLEERSPIW
jgi:dynein heavy chain